MTKNYSRRGNPEYARRDPHVSQEEERPHHPSASLVSVVVPCYNQAHFLGEAIESVLAQSHPNFEIVVVDDGSTDDTSEVAARYPKVRVVRQENRGLSAARNAGLAHSEGEYVVFLDADDRLLSGALEVGLGCLEAHPECALASGRYRPIAADGSPLPSPQQYRIERDHYVELLREGPSWPPAAVVYRSSVFESVGGFDCSVNATADYDMYLRIARRSPIYQHDKVVAEYRLHSASMNHNFALMLESTLAVLRSQWIHVKGNELHEEAIKRGTRTSQDYYCRRLAYSMQAHAREGEWKQAVGDLLVLLRYPQAFFRAWLKLVSRVMRARRWLRTR